MAFNRRDFLTTMGLAAGSLMLPSLAGRKRGMAQATTPRVIFISTSHGTVYDNWRMRPAFAPASLADVLDWSGSLAGLRTATMQPGSSWDVADPGDFSRILSPLSRFGSRLNVFDGLATYTAFTDSGGGNEHYKGSVTQMTGGQMRTISAGVYASTHPSLDQLIAAKIARADRLSSLQIGTFPTMGAIYDLSTNPISGVGTPRDLFDRLFAAPTGGTDKVAQAQGSVLDLVRGEYDALSKQLGAKDRQKLETHRDMIRDLEARLNALATLQCKVPPRPADIPFSDIGYTKAVWDAYVPMLAATLACEVTRVISVTLPNPTYQDLSLPAGDLHQEYAHHAEDQPVDAKVMLAKEAMTRYHTYNASLVAQLCDALDAYPDGGGTLLDNTLVVWLGELGTGGHKYFIWPAVTVGGGNLIKTGRYLHLGQKIQGPPASDSTAQAVGQPHNRLLVSIGNAFGLSVSSVGLSKVSFLGTDYDLTGGLPGF